MGQCPMCRLLLEAIEDRPNGVALHHCEPPDSDGPMALVAIAASKQGLTMEDASVAGARVMLAQALEGKPFDPAGYGTMLAGMAKLKASGGDGDDEALKLFFGTADVEEE